ncbi:MAG TPA: hypothetical protein VIV60_12725 [Polyangiaceae bacterium]
MSGPTPGTRVSDTMIALHRQTDHPETFHPSGVQRRALPAPSSVDGVILIVDVDRAHRDGAQTALLTNGLMAIATSSELRALELLRHGALFDAVVIAPGGQQGSDMTLIQQIHRQRPDLPIVAILSDDLPQARTQARQNGAQCCVSRSIAKLSLAATLRTVVAGLRLGGLPTDAGRPEPVRETLGDQ